MRQRRDAVDRRPLGRSDDHGWHYGYLFAPALTVGGAPARCSAASWPRRVLGLRQDLDVEAGRTWAESQRAGG